MYSHGHPRPSGVSGCGERPAAVSLPAALGFTLPLATGTKALLDKSGEAETLAALDKIAQQISEGHCLTLADSEPYEQGVAAPLALGLQQRAHDLQEADDALVTLRLRQQHASPAAPTADEATPSEEEARPHPDHPDDDLLDPRAMSTIVFTALLVRLPDEAKLAESSPDGLHEHAARDEGTWWTLDQLAAAAACPAGTARYRACAAAIAKVDSYMQPTGDTPHFLRWGVQPEANANSSAAEHATAAIGLGARLEAAAKVATEFQKILESARTTGTGESDGHAESAHALAPLVDTTPGATLPAELLPLAPPAPPADAALRPFRHTAVIFPTDPLPEPKSQTPPEDGFWPHDVRDIVEGWALNEIRARLAACLEWHRSGGPAHGRPHPIAFGEDAIKPRARGRLWDLRGGPGNVKLFDPATEPKRTGLDLEFAAAEFADVPGRELISMICDGVQMKTGHMAHQIVLMPNLLSLYSEDGGVNAAASQVAEMQKLGFLATFSQLPGVPFRAMPRGVVPKKGTEERSTTHTIVSPPSATRWDRSSWPRNGLTRRRGSEASLTIPSF